jgi:hypothetical protein
LDRVFGHVADVVPFWGDGAVDDEVRHAYCGDFVRRRWLNEGLWGTGALEKVEGGTCMVEMLRATLWKEAARGRRR